MCLLEEELFERVQKYRALTKKALSVVSLKKGLSAGDKNRAKQLLDMAKNYFDDACFFESRKELVLALAAFSYAHAWLDAGARVGLLDGKQNDWLFTLP